MPPIAQAIANERLIDDAHQPATVWFWLAARSASPVQVWRRISVNRTIMASRDDDRQGAVDGETVDAEQLEQRQVGDRADGNVLVWLPQIIPATLCRTRLRPSVAMIAPTDRRADQRPDHHLLDDDALHQRRTPASTGTTCHHDRP